MSWLPAGFRKAVAIVAGAGLIVGATALGIRIPNLHWLPGLPSASALDYSSPPAGGFAPLQGSFLTRVLGTKIVQDESPQASNGTVIRFPGRTDEAAVESHPLTNDEWSNARPVGSLPYDAKTDTTAASRENGEPTSCSAVGGTVWYRYDAVRSGGLVATTEGSRYATSLAVFSGESLSALKPLGCKTATNGSSRLAFVGVAGTRYYVQIAGVIGGGHLLFGLARESVVSLVSGPGKGPGEPGSAHHPTSAGNGRFIVFNYNGSDLDRRCPCGDQVYLRDLATGSVEIVSLSNKGDPSKGANCCGDGEAVVSADGRYIAFTSFDGNLVRGDRNGRQDVFVRDRVKRTTRRISIEPNGRRAASRVIHPKISADGRYVTTWSDERGMDPRYPDAFGAYRHDLKTGAIQAMTLTHDGRAAEFGGAAPSISGNGRFVAFLSFDTELVEEGPGPVMSAYAAWNTYTRLSPVLPGFWEFWVGHMYVRDAVTGRTVNACTSSSGEPANDSCHGGALSADGRYIVRTSSATNLMPLSIPTERAGLRQVYVKDLLTGRIELVSRSSSGEAGGDPGGQFSSPVVRDTGLWDPRTNPRDRNQFTSISGDGRYVAFDSAATNLVDDDTNTVQDVFVHDRVTGRTTRISVSATGQQLTRRSNQPWFSHDGNSVTFASEADDLVPNDNNSLPDVFVWVR